MANAIQKATITPQIKYGGKIDVCQPGITEVEKSKECGIVSKNKIRNARKGMLDLVIDGLVVHFYIT